MKIFLVFLIAALSAFAADAPKPKPATQPEISSDLQAEIAVTAYEFAQAQEAARPYLEAAQKAQGAAQAAQQKGSAACTDKYNVTIKDHKVACVLKPEPAKPDVPKQEVKK
jgi:hypothetical protein